MISIELYSAKRRIYDGDRLRATCEDWSYGPIPAETYVGINCLTHRVDACPAPTHVASVPDGSAPVRHSEACLFSVPDGDGGSVELDADDLARAAHRGRLGVAIRPIVP